ncbi:MAG: alpha/beta fold hydrolase [Acetobacteraceae bacterium]|nr:alpha/beta fold hydrolase [Acetobacteraceae bacterium]
MARKPRRAAAREITVHFATNRMPEIETEGGPIIGFGSDLGPVDGTAVRFGTVRVRAEGGAYSLIDGSLEVAPEQLMAGAPLVRGSRDILGKLREDMKTGARPTIVTVHGFSNSFADAMERAATILGFSGMDANVFAFTWPSRGSALPIPLPYADYVHDRETARGSGVAMARTIRILYDFLDGLPAEEQCRQPIHLICHSMGVFAFRHAVQALMRLPQGEAREFAAATDEPTPGPGKPAFPALTAIPTEGPDPNRLRRTFDQIILAAGDEDDDAFEDPQELKYLPRLAKGVTVYHTGSDWVLNTLSRFTKFNGPRLGVSGPDNMGAISDKVTAVDVSDVIGFAEDPQSHQYYRIFPKVRDDIVAVLKGARPGDVPKREPLAAQRYRIKP